MYFVCIVCALSLHYVRLGSFSFIPFAIEMLIYSCKIGFMADQESKHENMSCGGIDALAVLTLLMLVLGVGHKFYNRGTGLCV